jgi:enoyl-CoA hydratase
MASVSTEVRDEIATIRLDDGKANALTMASFDAIREGLDRAEKEAEAVVILGREGRLTGGFDLSVMGQGATAARDLVRQGAELLMRMYGFGKPIVVGCTGHAVAMGALLLLAADRRVGTLGSFKIGLNEVGIGMALPIFGTELAQARLSRRHLDASVVQARMFAPEEAKDAGYLDLLVEASALEDTARAEAQRLSSDLKQPAFAITKRRLHEATLARIRDTLEDDLARALPG